MPEKLQGLKVDQFAHPDDIAAMRSLAKLKAVDKFTAFIENQSNSIFIRMNTLGNCVRITPDSSPRIYRILQEVCYVLDYNRIPEIYGTHSFALDIQPSGVDNPVLVIPDFVLNYYDDNLLRFDLGRAVTRLKSGSLKFFIAAQMLILTSGSVELLSEPVKLGVSNWMRKSELTADRGGLLACQDFRTAMAFLFNKAGMPISEAKKVPYMAYLDACKVDTNLAKIGKTLQTLTNCSGWANDRITELFTWKASGRYDDLLEEFLD